MALASLPCAPARAVRFGFEDLAVGQRASLMHRVGDGDLVLPLGGWDDDPAGGEGRGARGQGVAEGLFAARLVFTVLGSRLPGAGATCLSQSFQFLGPLWPGSVVTASAEVVELVPSRRRVRLFCECVGDGRPVLEGEAWMALEPRG